MATNNSKKTNSKSSTKKASGGSKKQTTPNYQKVAVKAVKKAAKKNPKVFWIVLLVAVVVIGLGIAVYFIFLKDKLGPKSDSSSEPTSSEPISSESHSHQIVNTGISINFLEFQNYHTGDCVFIKAGDADILIDAGSTNENVGEIKSFINERCTDGKLEYVIATHAHTDHIGGFYDEGGRVGIFNTYKIGTLIDFPLTRKDGTKTTTKYGKYVRDREARKTSGDIEHHYSALQCWNQTNGATRQFTIAEGITLDILYQKYYEELDPDTNAENNYSVCTMINQGDNHYLFTGDLEGDGEASLIEHNDLPHCQLFKGGHHGSGTSNTAALLEKITPEVVCICCCAGNDEYTSDPANMFPYQETINRLAVHTDKIYVTSVSTDGHKGFAPMNGNILFRCENGIDYTVTGSNNSTILKETDWFKANRTWPVGGK